jgi:hypothetical protein
MVAIKNCYNDDDDGNGVVFPIQRVMADERRLIYGEHQKIFWGQVKVASSRDRPSCRNQSRTSAVPSISTLSSLPTMVGPTLPA